MLLAKLLLFFLLANLCFVQYTAALFVSLFLVCIKVGGKTVREADLVSSALSLHPQCTSNCGFIWYCTLQVSLCAPFCVCQNKKILTD